MSGAGCRASAACVACALLFGRSAPPEKPERDLATRRDVVALDAALARLPAELRVLLGLMYFERESLTRAAHLIDVSKGQASKLHKRALELPAQGSRESAP